MRTYRAAGQPKTLIPTKLSLQYDLSFNNVDYPQHWEREDITVEVEASLTHIGRYLLPKHPT